jgi:hypothetical protein
VGEKGAKSRTLVGVLQIGILLIYGELFLPGILRRQFGFPAGDIAYSAAVALIACAIVGFMGAWREIGFRRPDSWRTLWWFSPLVLGLIPSLPGHLYAGVWDTAVFALLYLAQSVQQRVIFDGLMIRTLLPLGLWMAALVPGLLQGAMLAAEFTQVTPEDGFVQILLLLAASTAATGFAWAALRIRTGLVWPLIIVDVVSGIIYYMTLSPDASPYPLTRSRFIYFSAEIIFGLVVGGIALLSARRRESIDLMVAPTTEDRQPTGYPARGRWAISCLALLAGSAVLVYSFGSLVTDSGGGARLPEYQQGSQHAYSAARPGTHCDAGSGHWWDDDPEERYTCRPDGLAITQLKFDYEGEAYFAFADEDQSSVPFQAHDYWVSVDAKIVGGKPGTCVDLHVHVQDFQGRQTFSACDDGSWSIGRCDLHCGTDVVLLSGNLAEETEQFALEVHVTDAVMTFIVNGRQVAVLEDNTYQSTDQLVLAVDGPEDASDLPSAVFSNFRYAPTAK